MTKWAMLTGEYPPEPGGVSDNSQMIARGLAAAGDSVIVYSSYSAFGPSPRDDDVEVVRLPQQFSPKALCELDRLLIGPLQPDRILIQYAPHAYGYKAMNLPFAAWVNARTPHIAPVDVMFHEVMFPFSFQPLRHAVLSIVTRLMARLLIDSADRIFVAAQAWNELLRQIAPSAKPSKWLPIPSNLPTLQSMSDVLLARDKYATQHKLLVGHFGTFGPSVTTILFPTLLKFAESVPESSILLIGRNSESFRSRILLERPDWKDRFYATGDLSPTSASLHLRACDLLIQPFVDGVSSRRSSLMAGLANGLPVVTNVGDWSESIWLEGGVASVSTPTPSRLAEKMVELSNDPRQRSNLAQRGLQLYQSTFALDLVIAKLREGATRDNLGRSGRSK